LSDHNTFRLRVTARYLIELHDAAEIRQFINSPEAAIKPWFVLGGGSNVLFADNYPGIIRRPVIKGIEIVKEGMEGVLVRAGAGEDWDMFVAWCVKEGLGGVENLSLIPGTVGASPVQNIGAYGAEIGEVIHAVEMINLESGKVTVLPAAACRFSYRDSIFKNELRGRVIITHVTYRLTRNHVYLTRYGELEKELENFPEINLETVRQAVIDIRNRKLPDPRHTGNAGSFFKNPVIPLEQARSIQQRHATMPVYPFKDGLAKVSAAWLIESCGWKDKRIGNVGTYRNQPLIIVNLGNATGMEILAFTAEIQKSVMRQFGIRLEREVNVV
jgi:UDP-N-acetylmuramate dehydrogenase